MAFAYIGDRHREDTALLVRGVQADADAFEIHRGVGRGYPAPNARSGDVITLVASQRPIARIEVDGNGNGG